MKIQISHLPKVENGLNYDHKPLKIHILLSQERQEGGTCSP